MSIASCIFQEPRRARISRTFPDQRGKVLLAIPGGLHRARHLVDVESLSYGGPVGLRIGAGKATRLNRRSCFGSGGLSDRGGGVRPCELGQGEDINTITSTSTTRGSAAVHGGRTPDPTAGPETVPTSPSPATESAVLPLVACPTTYGVSPTSTDEIPSTVAESVPTDLAGAHAVYTDGQGSMKVLGPTGWSCAANYGADGSGGVQVYPSRTVRSKRRQRTGGICPRDHRNAERWLCRVRAHASQPALQCCR